jgi:hypothetical protein
MNLLIYSHYFAPSVGGVGTIVQSLAAGSAELRTLNGDREFNVTVVTETAADGYDDTKFPFVWSAVPGLSGCGNLCVPPMLSTQLGRHSYPCFWLGFRVSDSLSSTMAIKQLALMDFLSTNRVARFVPVISRPAVMANVSSSCDRSFKADVQPQNF